MALSREATVVQNPALGAVMLWRFACGFCEKHETKNCPPLPLAFLVLPIVLHSDSFADLAKTRIGLRAFADKFTDSANPRADLVLAIHDRTAAWRGLSLAALQIGVRTQLVTIVTDDGTIMPLSAAKPSGVPDSVRPLLNNAEKLGGWFASLSIFEVSSILKVRF